jgi:hypothetical protein
VVIWNEPMGRNGALLQLLVFVQETQICTLVTCSSSSPAQNICAHFPQCPQPTQVLVDTDYTSLQYKDDVLSLSPNVELHCRDTLDFFVDIRKSFVLDVLFIVGTTRSKYGSSSTACPSVTQQRGALRLHSTAAQFS